METLVKDVAVMPNNPCVGEAVVTMVTPLAQCWSACLNSSALTVIVHLGIVTVICTVVKIRTFIIRE